FTDPHVLDESPGTTVPIDGRHHVGDGEDRNDPRVGGRAIQQHLTILQQAARGDIFTLTVGVVVCPLTRGRSGSSRYRLANASSASLIWSRIVPLPVCP